MSDIIKVLRKIDPEKIEYQIVNDCAIKSTAKEGYNEVIFCTDKLSPDQLISGTGKKGILIWVNPEDIEAALKE